MSGLKEAEDLSSELPQNKREKKEKLVKFDPRSCIPRTPR